MNMKSLAIIASILTVVAGSIAAATIGRASDRVPAPSRDERAQRDLEIAAWSRALAADSQSALALSQLSGLHLQRARESGDWSDYLEAERLARRSLDFRVRRNGRTYVVLVSSLLAQHRFTEARASADSLVRYFPDEPAYRALLGETQLELGDYVAANRSFAGLARYRTHLSIAGRLARHAEITGDLQRARRLLRDARNEALVRSDVTAEQRAWFRMRYAEMEHRAGRPRTAQRELDSALAERPDDPRLLAAMARFALARRDHEQAMAWGERALALSFDPATLGLLSDAALATGDSAKGEEYDRAMEVAVSAQPGAYHRGWTLHLLDRNRRVDEVLSRAEAELRIRPDVYGWDVYAWALFRAGRIPEAVAASNTAIHMKTADPLLYRHAAAIAAAAGQQSRSRALSRRAHVLGDAS